MELDDAEVAVVAAHEEDVAEAVDMEHAGLAPLLLAQHLPHRSRVDLDTLRGDPGSDVDVAGDLADLVGRQVFPGRQIAGREVGVAGHRALVDRHRQGGGRGVLLDDDRTHGLLSRRRERRQSEKRGNENQTELVHGNSPVEQ